MGGKVFRFVTRKIACLCAVEGILSCFERRAKCRTSEAFEYWNVMNKSIKRYFAAVAIFGFFAAGAFVLSTRTAAGQAAQQEQTSTGAELFAQNCARCHGETGHGGKGPDLTSQKRKEKWKDSDEKIVNKITNGGFIMPSFKKKLDADQINSIAEYVRTLKP